MVLGANNCFIKILGIKTNSCLAWRADYNHAANPFGWDVDLFHDSFAKSSSFALTLSLRTIGTGAESAVWALP